MRKQLLRNCGLACYVKYLPAGGAFTMPQSGGFNYAEPRGTRLWTGLMQDFVGSRSLKKSTAIVKIYIILLQPTTGACSQCSKHTREHIFSPHRLSIV